MTKNTRRTGNRLYKYIVKQKALILLGILSTMLMSLIELFTGSLLKFLTKTIGKFTDAYEAGFPKGVKLPVKFSIDWLQGSKEFLIINKTFKGQDDIFKGLLMLCLIFIVLFLLESIFNYSRRVFMNAATQRILLNFKSDIYKKILRLPFSFFARNKTGDLVSRITFDVTALNEIIELFIEVARMVVYILVFIPIMLVMSWQLTIFTLLFFPVSIVLIEIVTRYIKRIGKKITDNVGDYTAFLEEKINRSKLIKGFSTEEKEQQEFDKLIEKNFRFNLRLIKLKFSMNPTNDFLSMMALAVVYLFFSYKLTHKGASIADIVFYLYLMRTLFKPVKKVAQAWGQLHIAIVSTKKIFLLLDETEEKFHLTDGTAIKLDNISSIELKNISFSYPNNERKILNNINLKVNKGDIVYLEGKSGIGKSTLLTLIPAFYSANSGSIQFNNQPLEKYNLEDVRSNIAIVDSNCLFMNHTLRANIEYCGIKISAEQEKEFTQFMGLQATSELDLVIGKDGIDLSEGQKQKLSFVRAIISKPSVLILDEAFASLDKEDITYILEKSSVFNIVFVVSRKPEVIKYATRRISLVCGEVIE